MIHEPSKLISALRSPEKESKAARYRRCEELRSAYPENESGGHWIDPDGVATEDPPVYVYCNMTTGSSQFIHFNILEYPIFHGSDSGIPEIPQTAASTCPSFPIKIKPPHNSSIHSQKTQFHFYNFVTCKCGSTFVIIRVLHLGRNFG